MPNNSSEVILSPIRLLDSKAGEFLAVRGVRAQIDNFGPFCRTRFDITFSNDLARTLEGDLVVPLPPSAALRELTVRVGARQIEGKIRPRQRARAEYRRAVEAGQTAALGESEGEDMARLRIAPIAAGEDVEVRMQLVHTLLPSDCGHRLVLPLTYMPRFVESEAALKPTERAALDRPRPLTSAARARVEITIRHGASGPPAIRSTSHPTETRVGEQSTTVTLTDAPLDRDFHLEIQDRPEGGEPGLWIVHDPSEGPDQLGPSTAVAIVPPAFADEGPVIPRKVTFLVDRSGSMQGGPMDSAIRAVRGALRSLTPADRFNIIAFDDRLEALAARALRFDDAGLSAADRFIAGIHARGGTNASMAIAAALQHHLSEVDSIALRDSAPPPDPGHRLDIVVFMTDGDVAGAEQVLRTAKDKLVDTRVFVLGIGDAVNHAMLSQIAAAGGGAYFPVATDEDLEQTLNRLKDAIDSPLWTGVGVVLEHEGQRRQPQQLEPPTSLDLFARQPLLLAFRGPIAAGERLILSGQRPGGEDRRIIVPLLTEARDEQDADAARITWAVLRNRRLTYRFDADDDPTLEGLGVAFGLVNRAVALVGVDPQQSDLVIEGSVPVSLPLPENLAQSRGRASARKTAIPRGAAPKIVGHIALPGRSNTMDSLEIEPSRPRPAAKPASAPRPAPRKRASKGSSPPPPPPPRSPALAAGEAGLRDLMLRQSAFGLFDGDLAITLAAVAVFVTRGHTHREGLFRAELRRTIGALKAQLGTATGDERVFAALALAMLTMAAGEAAPPELSDELTATLAGLAYGDSATAKQAIKAALALVPTSFGNEAAVAELLDAFQLR